MKAYDRVEEITEVMLHKASLFPDQLDIPTIVQTVVADTLLIADGDLTVEDFR